MLAALDLVPCWTSSLRLLVDSSWVGGLSGNLVGMIAIEVDWLFEVF